MHTKTNFKGNYYNVRNNESFKKTPTSYKNDKFKSKIYNTKKDMNWKSKGMINDYIIPSMFIITPINQINYPKMDLPLIIDFPRFNRHSTSGVMICDSCYNSITSEKHHSSCVNIQMWQIKEQNIEPTIPFKTMMTFGLGGCTAIIIALFDKITNKPIKVIFGHHPDKEDVFNWFTSNYSSEYNIVTVIKSPGDYVKVDSKWIMEATDKLYWEEKIIKSTSKLIIEPYSLDMMVNESNFRSSLYCKYIDGILKYSNEYGVFKSINY